MDLELERVVHIPELAPWTIQNEASNQEIYLASNAAAWKSKHSQLTQFHRYTSLERDFDCVCRTPLRNEDMSEVIEKVRTKARKVKPIGTG